MRAALVNELLTMVMSEINTFMSDGTVNEDAESPELERGAWPCRGEAAWQKRRPYWRRNAASRCGKRIGICNARVRSDVRSRLENRRCRRPSKFLGTCSRNCVRIPGAAVCR